MDGRAYLAAVLAALPWAAAPLAAQKVELAAPPVRYDRERWDLEVRSLPPQGTLGELIRILDGRITGQSVVPVAGGEVGPENIPSLDLFGLDLQERLAKGRERPIEIVLGQARRARETLRLAYNDVAAAEPALSEARDALKEAAEKLSPLLEKNRASLRALGGVVESAQATVSAMTPDPPASTGDPVPVRVLCSITPLKPEIQALEARLRQASGKLREARGRLAAARAQGDAVGAQTDEAEAYYAATISRLNESRVAGRPTSYYSKTQLHQIIDNANSALVAVLAESERLAALMAAQLDAGEEGVRKAVRMALEADARTQAGRVLAEHGGSRINFNHAVRLRPRDGLIPRGYEIAANSRRQSWWAGRAGLAISEARTDLSKMRGGLLAAEDRARGAQGALEASLQALALIDQGLGGDGAFRPQAIAGQGGSSEPVIRPGELDASGAPPKPVELPILGISRETLMGLFEAGGSP